MECGRVIKRILRIFCLYMYIVEYSRTLMIYKELTKVIENS